MGADPSDESTKLDAFRGALEKLGYIDGQTIVMARPPQWATPVEPVSVEPPSPTGTIGKALPGARNQRHRRGRRHWTFGILSTSRS
jgi:hypothetical protein